MFLCKLAKFPLIGKQRGSFPNLRRVKLDNYISILPTYTVSKVLERAVHTQLYNYLQSHKMLSPYQCGFRKSYSTELTALCLADTIRWNIDLGQMTGAVYIDLRKAFDTVDHNLLLRKLSYIGVTNWELDWFMDYSRNRTQVVDYQGVLSNPEEVSIGVPQGSILGPLLFILHVNDLSQVVTKCSILMYADDTVLFFSAKQASIIEETLNKELAEIDQWLYENSLFINVSKTEAMLFGTTPKLCGVDSFSINVNGVPLKRVSHFKYLGVVFDERLSWNEHVRYILAKASSRVGMLGRIRRNVTLSSANIVYTSLIRLILEYCDTVWGCCGLGNSNAIENLQKRTGRLVVKTSRSDDAMAQLKWPTLASRRDKHTLSLVKKCINGHCPQYFNNYFTFNNRICSRVTRQSNLLHLPAVRTEIAKRSFYYNGCI